MKLPSSKELDSYNHALAVGALKGATAGSLVAAGAGAYLRRRGFFRNNSPFAKTMVIIAPVIACTVTWMESASRRFEEENYGKELLEIKHDEELKRQQQPFLTRTKEWAIDNKYRIIMGGWAASITGSFWYINRDKYMTKQQKIVQARVYAQGLTVALLVASMALTTVSTGEERRRKQAAEEDQAWKRIMDQETKRLEANHENLHLSADELHSHHRTHEQQKQQPQQQE